MARVQMETLENFELTADGGTCDALYDLGLIYSTGRGVDVDLVTAHKWFNLAAVRGSEAARQLRGELAAEMTTEEVAEAQRQAREWLASH